jgi:hypothetical protein
MSNWKDFQKARKRERDKLFAAIIRGEIEPNDIPDLEPDEIRRLGTAWEDIKNEILNGRKPK